MKSRGVIQVFALFLVLVQLQLLQCTNLDKLPATSGPLLAVVPSRNYGEYPLSVSFLVRAIPSRGDISELILDYGDGEVEDIRSKLQGDKLILEHVYERPGVFYVRLYGKDKSGASRSESVIITNDKPMIINAQTYRSSNFTDPASDFVPGLPVYFRAICKDANGISVIIINWGDGQEEFLQECMGSHIYNAPGDYVISLYVYDDNRFAPYPLSNSVSLKIRVFEGAGVQLASSPFISVIYDYVKADSYQTYGDSILSTLPSEVGLYVGIYNLGSNLKIAYIDWGDGKADVLRPESAIRAGQGSYIFKLSHSYTKEISTYISIIAENSEGKRSSKSVGPIVVRSSAPLMYVSYQDQYNQNPSEKNYSPPVTISTKFVAFDGLGFGNTLYFVIEGKISGFNEVYIKMIDKGIKFDILQHRFSVERLGNYTVSFYLVPDLAGAIPYEYYCSDAGEIINGSLCGSNGCSSVCDSNRCSVDSISECQLYKQKLESATGGGKLGVVEKFKFSVGGQ